MDRSPITVTRSTQSQRWVWPLLALVLLLAAQFRFQSLYSWDGETFQHPDERFIAYTVYNLRMPRSIGDYLRSGCVVNGRVPNYSATIDLAGRALTPDRYEPSIDSGCNTLNPRNYGWGSFFVYGTLPTSLTRVVAELRAAQINPGSTDPISPVQVRNTGRTLSALFDLGSLLMVFLIARRLYGPWVALAASLLYASAVLPIQLAHFFTVDSATGFFVLLTIYWAVRASQNGGMFVFLMLGLSIGAAMASRITMATLGMLAILAVLVRLWGQHWLRERSATGPTWGAIIRMGLLLLLAGATTMLTFRVLAPDSFVGTTFFDLRLDPRFVKSLSEVAGFVSGQIDAPFSQQWANRTPYVFPLSNMIIWGMGLPLGLAAWLAWLAAGLQIVRRRDLRPLLPVVWIGFYMAWQGGQFGMTMRYYALLYGLLAILAAWGLFALAGHWQARSLARKPTRSQVLYGIARRLPLLIVLVGTVLWAAAFSAIYRTPHSRIAASHWIYANIPAGATITSEIWDDPLPLKDGGNPNQYTLIKTAPYDEDELAKYTGYIAADGTRVEGLIDQLERADYVILASNRVYDSALRLPMRYPALTRYYESLFNGKLGYELAADIHSYPRLGGLTFPDQHAEEAFSVYDHPRVLIFRKTASFNRDTAERLLTANIAWDEIDRLPTVMVRTAPTALRLTENDWPILRPAGTWASLFPADNLAARLPWLAWLLAWLLLSWAAFALCFRPLRALPDRGFAITPILGPLLVATIAWLLGSTRLLAFSPGSVWLLSGLFVALGLAAAWLQRQELADFVRTRWPALLTSQIILLLAFGLFVTIRSLNPDFWHPARAGDKPLLLGIFTAVLKSPFFPPYDPWFAGGLLNDRYFGLLPVAVLTHLTGLAPALALNLALATCFAQLATGAWALAYNLVAARLRRLARGRSAAWLRQERHAITTGIVSMLLVTVAGTLVQAFWLLPGSAPSGTVAADAAWVDTSYATQQNALGRQEWAFWDAPRLVGSVTGEALLNDVPFSALLFGDPSQSVLALPLVALTLVLLVGLYLSITQRRIATEQTPDIWSILTRVIQPVGGLLLLALALATLEATNHRMAESMLLFSLATLTLAGWLNRQRGQPFLGELFSLIGWIGIVLVGMRILLQPINQAALGDQRLQLWFGPRTPMAEILLIDGMLLLALISAGALLYRRARRLGRLPILVVSVLLVLLALVLAFFKLQGLILLGVLFLPAIMILADLATLTRRADQQYTHIPQIGSRSFLLLAWGVGLIILALMPELVSTRGDGGRFETVQDLGLLRWVAGGTVTAIGLGWAWGRMVRAGVAGWLWCGLVALIGVGMLAYPLTATPARIADRVAADQLATLDGSAYLPAGQWQERDSRFSFAEDAATITWLRANISGTPIILEAEGEPYRWSGRIAANTGLPTLLGWSWYELRQRAVIDAERTIQSRQQVIRTIYDGGDAAESLRLLKLYGVEYVVVGQLERALYNPAHLAVFDTMAQRGELFELHANGATRIYQVSPGEHFPAILTTSRTVQFPITIDPPQVGMLDQTVGSLPASDPYPTFGSAGAGEQIMALLFWFLAWFVIQLLGLPLAMLLFGQHTTTGWDDAGVTWARPIGLLLVGYAVWLPVSLGIWYYTRTGIAIGVGLVAGLNLALLAWVGAETRAILRQRLRQQRRAMLQTELVALAAFLFLLLLRALNPDLWQPYWGGEKPFEFGLLNAVVRSPVMPPYSPFFSDGVVNYYYYGFFLVSLAVKAVGITPAVAFNLIVPTLFGLFCAGVFGLAARIAGKAWVGAAAVGLVALFGNLAAAFPVGWSGGLGPVRLALQDGLVGFGERLGSWFVGSSRVIPNTINEFPFWGFLFADLHPHLIALPFSLLLMALAWQRFTRKPSDRMALPWPVVYGLAALALGALAITNSWDVPTATLLLAGVLAGRAWQQPGLLWQRLRGGVAGGLAAGATALLGLLLYWPFFARFDAPVGGIGLVTTPSPLREFLLIYGLPLALLIPVLLGTSWRVLNQWNGQPLLQPLGIVARPASLRSMPQTLMLLAGLLIIIVAAGAVALPTLAPERWPQATSLPILFGTRFWLGLLALVSLPALLSRRLSATAWYATWLAGVALAVALGCEVVYIRDHLAGGDWYRMNTVFKFGLQIWVLFGLAAALALPRLGAMLERLPQLLLILFSIFIMLLVGLALVFPLVGIPSRVAYRFEQNPGPTLDGLAFLDTATYSVSPGYLGLPEGTFPPQPVELKYDAEAMRWLNANLRGTPIVLQSSAEFYRLYGVRVAANTGLPTVVSPLHEAEQREPSLVYQRDADVQRCYRTTDSREALAILLQYGVEYVYVGPIERIIYGDQGLAKFDSMARPGGALSIAHKNEQVTIYAVNLIAARLATQREPEQSDQAAPGSEAELRRLEQLVITSPDNLAFAWQLAARYAERNRYADAVRVLQPHADERQADVGLQQFYAELLGSAGRLDEAEAAYRRAIAADPTAANYTHLGVALAGWGRSESATMVLLEAIALDPTLSEPYFYLGQLAEERTDTQQAVQYYTRFLELSPPDDPYRGPAEDAMARLGG